MVSSLCSLRVLIANIEKYKHLERFIPFCVKVNPEIVLLQEVPFNGLCHLAKAVGATNHFFVPMALDTSQGLHDEPTGLAILLRLKDPQDGIACYSEFFYRSGIFNRSYLPNFTKDKNFSCDNYIQHVEVVKSGTVFAFGNTYFPWTPDGAPDNVQYECMPKVVTYAKLVSLIVCGDFNAPRTLQCGTKGPIWDMLARKFRDNIPLDVESTLDPVLHHASKDGVALPLVVDGLFTPLEYRAENVVVHSGVSDHRPISAVIHRVS